MVAYERKNMTALMLNALEKGRAGLRHLQTALGALNPLAVLERGYSLTTKMPEGWIVREARSVAPRDDVRIRLARGGIRARIMTVHEED